MKQLARFWSHVNKLGHTQPHMKTRCWEWTGSKSKFGHGRFHFQGVTQWAHRVSWFIAHGEWPTPCCLHRCDYPPCVRPGHLFEGTKSDNSHDMHSKRRANSPSGEASGKNKLSSKEVDEIRLKYRTGKYTQTQLGSEYGVGRACISSIVVRRTWA